MVLNLKSSNSFSDILNKDKREENISIISKEIFNTKKWK